MRGLVLASVMLGFTVSAFAADKSPLEGKWIVESLSRDGKADESLKGATRVHDGEKYSVTPAEGTKGVAVSGTAAVDASKSPITIDMKPAAGRYKDKTLLGIAKVEGDKLTIAFAEPGKDRPTTFESKAGSGVIVAVHKKAK